MDDIDQRIISLLSADGRASVTKIAQTINRSRVATQNRIDALVRNGDILGFTAVLRPRAITALFEVRLHPKQLCEKLLPRVRDHYLINRAWSVSGTSDLFIWAEVDAIDQLQEMHAFLATQAEVAYVYTHTVIKHHA